MLRGLRAGGASIVVVSSDLDELFNLADRILVMRGGEFVGEYAPAFNMQTHRRSDDRGGTMRRWLDGALHSIVPIVVAFVLGFILFAATGYDVAEVADGLWQGAAAAPGSLEQSLRWALPLAVVSLGIIITLRTGEFNIGAQGQILLGGLGAVAVALLLPESPPLIVIPLAIVCGIIAGALWSAIAGALKVWFNSDEVINTLMLNFIAVLLIQWVTTGPFQRRFDARRECLDATD